MAPADPHLRLLSRRELIELHVFEAIRRAHHIRVADVRNAIEYLSRELGVAYGTPILATAAGRMSQPILARLGFITIAALRFFNDAAADVTPVAMITGSGH